MTLIKDVRLRCAAEARQKRLYSLKKKVKKEVVKHAVCFISSFTYIVYMMYVHFLWARPRRIGCTRATFRPCHVGHPFHVHDCECKVILPVSNPNGCTDSAHRSEGRRAGHLHTGLRAITSIADNLSERDQSFRITGVTLALTWYETLDWIGLEGSHELFIDVALVRLFVEMYHEVNIYDEILATKC